MPRPRLYNHTKAYKLWKEGKSFNELGRIFGVGSTSIREAIIRYEQKETDRRLVSTSPNAPLRRYTLELLKKRQNNKCLSCGKELPENPEVHHKKYKNATIADLEAYCDQKCHYSKNHSKK